MKRPTREEIAAKWLTQAYLMYPKAAEFDPYKAAKQMLRELDVAAKKGGRK